MCIFRVSTPKDVIMPCANNRVVLGSQGSVEMGFKQACLYNNATQDVYTEEFTPSMCELGKFFSYSVASILSENPNFFQDHVVAYKIHWVGLLKH